MYVCVVCSHRFCFECEVCVCACLYSVETRNGKDVADCEFLCMHVCMCSVEAWRILNARCVYVRVCIVWRRGMGRMMLTVGICVCMYVGLCVCVCSVLARNGKVAFTVVFCMCVCV